MAMNEQRIPVNEVCRLCMVQGDASMEDIFSDDSTHQSLAIIIAAVTQLEVRDGDGMPPKVCQQCIFQLKSANKFKKRCIAADRALRNIYYEEAFGASYWSTSASAPERIDNPEDSSRHSIKIEIEENSFDYNNSINISHSVFTQEKPTTRKKTKTSVKNKNIQPFSCDICNNSFTTRKTLIRHIRTHTGHRPHECETCNKRFSTKTSLKIHRMIHTSERPHECTICKNKFRAKNTLKRHLLTHSSEKPHICTVCDRPFRLSKTLKVHMKMHSGERPFSCPVCKKTFGLKRTLDSHMRSHYKTEKNFQCETCKVTFAKHHLLTEHILRTHAELSELESLDSGDS